MNCLCNLFSGNTGCIWIVIIALLLLCNNGCGYSNGCGCNNGCGC